MLVVSGGLPGTGKATVARAVAARCRAAYLRVDAIEQAMRSAGVLAAGGVGPARYMAAYAPAEANLRLGLAVVAGQLVGAVLLDVLLPEAGAGLAVSTLLGAALTLVAVVVSGRPSR